jgi:hypothetical protein
MGKIEFSFYTFMTAQENASNVLGPGSPAVKVLLTDKTEAAVRLLIHSVSYGMEIDRELLFTQAEALLDDQSAPEALAALRSAAQHLYPDRLEIYPLLLYNLATLLEWHSFSQIKELIARLDKILASEQLSFPVGQTHAPLQAIAHLIMELSIEKARPLLSSFTYLLLDSTLSSASPAVLAITRGGRLHDNQRGYLQLNIEAIQLVILADLDRSATLLQANCPINHQGGGASFKMEGTAVQAITLLAQSLFPVAPSHLGQIPSLQLSEEPSADGMARSAMFLTLEPQPPILRWTGAMLLIHCGRQKSSVDYVAVVSSLMIDLLRDSRLGHLRFLLLSCFFRYCRACFDGAQQECINRQPSINSLTGSRAGSFPVAALFPKKTLPHRHQPKFKTNAGAFPGRGVLELGPILSADKWDEALKKVTLAQKAHELRRRELLSCENWRKMRQFDHPSVDSFGESSELLGQFCSAFGSWHHPAINYAIEKAYNLLAGNVSSVIYYTLGLQLIDNYLAAQRPVLAISLLKCLVNNSQQPFAALEGPLIKIIKSVQLSRQTAEDIIRLTHLSIKILESAKPEEITINTAAYYRWVADQGKALNHCTESIALRALLPGAKIEVVPAPTKGKLLSALLEKIKSHSDRDNAISQQLIAELIKDKKAHAEDASTTLGHYANFLERAGAWHTLFKLLVAMEREFPKIETDRQFLTMWCGLLMNGRLGLKIKAKYLSKYVFLFRQEHMAQQLHPVIIGMVKRFFTGGVLLQQQALGLLDNYQLATADFWLELLRDPELPVTALELLLSRFIRDTLISAVSTTSTKSCIMAIISYALNKVSNGQQLLCAVQKFASTYSDESEIVQKWLLRSCKRYFLLEEIPLALTFWRELKQFHEKAQLPEPFLPITWGVPISLGTAITLLVRREEIQMVSDDQQQLAKQIAQLLTQNPQGLSVRQVNLIRGQIGWLIQTLKGDPLQLPLFAACCWLSYDPIPHIEQLRLWQSLIPLLSEGSMLWKPLARLLAESPIPAGEVEGYRLKCQWAAIKSFYDSDSLYTYVIDVIHKSKTGRLAIPYEKSIMRCCKMLLARGRTADIVKLLKAAKERKITLSSKGCERLCSILVDNDSPSQGLVALSLLLKSPEARVPLPKLTEYAKDAVLAGLAKKELSRFLIQVIENYQLTSPSVWKPLLLYAMTNPAVRDELISIALKPDLPFQGVPIDCAACCLILFKSDLGPEGDLAIAKHYSKLLPILQKGLGNKWPSAVAVITTKLLKVVDSLLDNQEIKRELLATLINFDRVYSNMLTEAERLKIKLTLVGKLLKQREIASLYQACVCLQEARSLMVQWNEKGQLNDDQRQYIRLLGGGLEVLIQVEACPTASPQVSQEKRKTIEAFLEGELRIIYQNRGEDEVYRILDCRLLIKFFCLTGKRTSCIAACNALNSVMSCYSSQNKKTAVAKEEDQKLFKLVLNLLGKNGMRETALKCLDGRFTHCIFTQQEINSLRKAFL